MPMLRNEQVPAVLAALRQCTQVSHKAVERLTPFFKPDFDRLAYVRWLDLMHGFYRRVDGAVERSSFSVDTGWRYQARCNLISRDLATLAVRPPQEPQASTGLLADLRGVSQTGEIAGMLYVVEGSALGGKVLLKVLERSAGVTSASGASFFSPHGETPEIPWAEYVQLMASLSTNLEIEQDIVRGAVTTFTALENWIGHAWRG